MTTQLTAPTISRPFAHLSGLELTDAAAAASSKYLRFCQNGTTRSADGRKAKSYRDQIESEIFFRAEQQEILRAAAMTAQIETYVDEAIKTGDKARLMSLITGVMSDAADDRAARQGYAREMALQCTEIKNLADYGYNLRRELSDIITR